MDYEKRPDFMKWCSEQQWENLKNSDLSAFNPKSQNYNPTPEDFKMTYDEWDNIGIDKQSLLVKEFYDKRKNELIKEKLRLAERDAIKLVDHWYNVIPKDDIIEAIEKSRSLADQVIDSINEVEKLEPFRKRNEELRVRVKSSNINLRPAEDKKLKRFPRYSNAKKELIYSKSSMLNLWSHVFSLRK